MRLAEIRSRLNNPFTVQNDIIIQRKKENTNFTQALKDISETVIYAVCVYDKGIM